MSDEAIRTSYAGCVFRSRLEARWAGILDGLGIEWEYEPRLITLPSGIPYLPDFWLPEIGTWLEVKGDGIPRIEKARELAVAVTCACRVSCTCRWFGGEIVLIGHTLMRQEGSPWQSLYWDDARYSSLLAECGHCEGYCWVRPRHSVRCRRCGVFDPQSLRLIGTAELKFSSVRKGAEAAS